MTEWQSKWKPEIRKWDVDISRERMFFYLGQENYTPMQAFTGLGCGSGC